ncbi:MAG: hypothetical protein HQL80_10110 [Magnetococcales bacterium]|nr:hypothetical protein [Magnetococcales bacterium]
MADAVRGRLEKKPVSKEQPSISVWRGTDIALGESFHTQITRTISKEVKHLVVLLTRNVWDPAKSEWQAPFWVRDEINLARREGVCIRPVLGRRIQDLDDKPITGEPLLTKKELPRFLRKYPCVRWDDDRGWSRLMSHLRQPCEVLRFPLMMGPKPETFVERAAELSSIKNGLLAKKGRAPVSISSALAGAGGFGKTWLATVVCYDEQIQDRFDDGILWVTLGERPQDLLAKMGGLIHALKREEKPPSNLDEARDKIKHLLDGKNILMVIDDVWRTRDLEPFLEGGEGTVCRLITTRNLAVLPPDTRDVRVDVMSRNESIKLLTAGLTKDFDDSTIHDRFERVAKQLGQWPLLLALANGRLRREVKYANMTLVQALEQAEGRLEGSGLAGFDLGAQENRDRLAAFNVHLSLELLFDEERRLFLECGIFPEDTEVPLGTVHRLWKQSGWTEDQGVALLHKLWEISLLQRLDFQAEVVRLHDIIRTHLRNLCVEKRANVQKVFLDSFHVNLWADLPMEEKYLWEHLQWHLEDGKRGEDWQTTLRDTRFLAAKVVAMKSGAAAARDLEMGLRRHPNDDRLALLQRLFLPLVHQLATCFTLADAMNCLDSYFRWLPEREALMGDWKPPSRLHLEPIHPMPDPPPPALKGVVLGQKEGILDCAFSLDGQWMASASADRTLCLRSSAGKLVHTLKGHLHRVRGCAFSPDGKRLLSASDDNTLRLWSVETGEVLAILGKTLRKPASGRTEESWGGRSLLIQSKSAQAQAARLGHVKSVTACAFSRDGQMIVSASADNTLRLWSERTMEELGPSGSGKTFGSWKTQRILKGHSDQVMGCAFSLDGTQVISASADNTLRLWSVETGRTLHVLEGHTHRVLGCAFSPDGTKILSASEDETLRLWSVETGETLHVLAGHDERIWDCAFSPDGQTVLSASGDKTLILWSVADGRPLRIFEGHSDVVRACAFSPDGKTLLSASRDPNLHVWWMEKGKIFVDFKVDKKKMDVSYTREGRMDSVSCCVFSGDSKNLLTVSWDRKVRIWSVETSKLIQTFDEEVKRAWDCDFSPDGQQIVVASEDYALHLFSVAENRRIKTLAGHRGAICGCSFSQDGQHILSGADDKTLRLWSVATGNNIQKMDAESSVWGCAISRDGQMAAAALENTTLSLWSVTTGKRVHILEGHTEAVSNCAFSQDGERLVSVSDDYTLRIWSVKTGQLLRTLAGHGDCILCAVFSPDDRHILSASYDSTLRLWDAHTGQCVHVFPTLHRLYDCNFSPDGRYVAATGRGGIYFLKLVGV